MSQKQSNTEQCKNCIRFIPESALELVDKKNADSQQIRPGDQTNGRRDCMAGGLVLGVSGCISEHNEFVARS